MKILLVDRDEVTNQLIKSRLEPVGHEIISESSKEEALKYLERDRFDLVMLDPSPLTSGRPLILNIRRAIGYYPYILLLSEVLAEVDALKAGANDVLAKPIDPEMADHKIEQVGRLVKLIRRLGDTDEDFPSAGGVIAKSAFNQLFMSAVERGDRYGEKSFALFMTLKNYADIIDREGIYAADYMVAQLSQELVKLRRRTDIIGQTGKAEFALLLNRPAYQTEPLEAAARFAQSLTDSEDLFGKPRAPAVIDIELVALPTGELTKVHHLP